MEFPFGKSIGVYPAVGFFSVADRRFAGATDDEIPAGRGDETELVIGDGEAVDTRADAGREQTKILRVEDLASLWIDQRAVGAVLVLQHRDRQRDLSGRRISGVGRNEERDHGRRGVSLYANDGLASNRGGVELVVIELGEVDVGAFRAVGRGNIDAHFPIAQRAGGEGEVVAVGFLAVGVGVAAVAAVDSVGINVIAVADRGREILGLRLVVVNVAGDFALEEIELEADIFANAFPGREGFVVDVARGVEVDFPV